RGKKYFELSNHLGNVMAVVSDKRISVAGGVYEADIISATDYAPFGMGLVGREYNFGDAYRYSINGQEKTPEIAPNTTTAEYWQYDARIGRRWNVDPKFQIGLSRYAVFTNSPIVMIDNLGDTSIFNIFKTEKEGNIELDFVGKYYNGNLYDEKNNEVNLSTIDPTINSRQLQIINSFNEIRQES